MLDAINPPTSPPQYDSGANTPLLSSQADVPPSDPIQPNPISLDSPSDSTTTTTATTTTTGNTQQQQQQQAQRDINQVQLQVRNLVQKHCNVEKKVELKLLLHWHKI